MSANKALALKDSYSKQIELRSDQYKAILGDKIPIERFKQVAMTAILTTKDIQNADQTSVLLALQKSAECGLLPDGRRGVINLYNSKHGPKQAQFLPMIRGVIELMHRGGNIKTITAGIVYEGERFKAWTDENGERIEHEPDWLGDRNIKDAKLTYALVLTTNGGKYIDIMTIKEVYKIRDKSNNYKWAKDKSKTIWAQHPEQMIKKTVLHRVFKKIHLENDHQEAAVRAIEDDIAIETEAKIVEPQAELPTSSKRLENLVENEKKAEKTPENERKPL